NPRKEAAILNARVRQRWRGGKFPIGVIGPKADLTYTYDYVGAGPETLAAITRHSFADAMRKAQRPMVIVGSGAFSRGDGAAVAALAAKAAIDLGAIKDGWNGHCVLHNAAARVGALDVGFVPGPGGLTARQMAAFGTLDLVFLLGVDELEIAPGAFVIYIGTHGDRGASRADVVLPGAAYPEKSTTYLNTEGRVQVATRASFPPGDAREDWAILRALSDVLKHRLPYDSLRALREIMYQAHPHLLRVGQITPGDAAEIRKLATLAGNTDKAPFTSIVDDFYLTNPIARASAVMAECSALALGRAAATAAESRGRTWRHSCPITFGRSRSCWHKAFFSSSFYSLSSLTCCWPIAKSGPQCRSGAGRTWSGLGACFSLSQICSNLFLRSPSFRLAP